MKLTIGRIVHYVLSASDDVHGPHSAYGSKQGQIAPAIVVAVWGENCANLIVFLDGSNHAYDKKLHPDVAGGFEFVPAMMRWVTSACYSESNEPRTWHWPPREEPAKLADPRGIVALARGDNLVSVDSDATAHKPTEEEAADIGRPEDKRKK